MNHPFYVWAWAVLVIWCWNIALFALIMHIYNKPSIPHFKGIGQVISPHTKALKIRNIPHSLNKNKSPQSLNTGNIPQMAVIAGISYLISRR